MHYSRSIVSKNRFRRSLITYLVFLLALSGLLPAAPSQVFAEEPFTINDTDSYGITPDGIIYQFDGYQPGPIPKSSITVTGPGEVIGLNGLAVDSNKDVLYAAGGTNLYSINPDGTSDILTNSLFAGAANAAISVDGTKYLYNYKENDSYHLGAYDLNTGEHSTNEIKGSFSGGNLANWGGDILVDNDGYIWVSRILPNNQSDLLQLDPDTYTVLREVLITSDEEIEFGARGLSFLPSGEILMVAGNNNPTLYLLNKDTMKATYLGAMSGSVIGDLASRVIPAFNPGENNSCTAPVALINGSFEEPPFSPDQPSGPGYFTIDQSLVPGWQTTDSSGVLEIFNQSLMDQITPGSPQDQQGLKNEVIHGQQMAELNSKEPAQLYQDVETTPGQVIYWRLAHKGRLGEDTMAVKIGAANVAPQDLPTIDTVTTGNEEWQYYSGTYTVPAGQTVTRFGFEAVSSTGGNTAAGNFIDDIFLGTEPCVVAEKSVSPEGEVFEGDELTYEVTVKNNGGDIAADTVFEDAIPEGTEYVPASMKIISGPNAGDLTDEEDGDAGYFDGDKVIITLGDLPNTTNLPDGITVQFKVKALASHTGESASNKAAVHYRNLLTGEDETTESNEVSTGIAERPEIPNACTAPVALVNGSFEEPPARMPGDTGSPGSEHAWMYFLEDEVPGWKTNASDKFIQIMKSEFIYNGYEINPPHGNQYAELNAEQVSALYQDVETTPGQTIYWRLAHKGLLGEDTMAVQIGSADVPADDLPVIEEISTGNSEWVYYSGTYTVPADQTITRFAFNSIDAAGGNQRFGNLLDDIFLGTEPCVVAEKSVSPYGEVFDGDVLTYEVTIKNEGGDIAANAVFEDAIPEGTEYVPGSMKIISGPNAGDLTDEEDGDAGYFDGDKVITTLGDLPNIMNLPDGITVQFKVKALSSYVGESASNKAAVHYKNLLTGEDETTESNGVSSDIVERPEIPNSCTAPVALINGSFEQGPTEGSYNASPIFFLEDEVPGWQTTDDSQGVKIIEIWNYAQQYPAGVVNFPAPPDGNRYAELNAFDNGLLYQDVETTPGQTIHWRLSHMGRQGVDTMQLRIGAATDNPYDTIVQTQMSSGNTAWETYAGEYTVPAGQTVTRFGFEAVSTAGGSLGAGNFLDDIFLGTEPCVTGDKTVSPQGDVHAGDELTYEVSITNSGGDIAANVVFEDAIPAGTEYVPGSMKIVSGPNAGDLTDETDGDAGHFDGDKVIIELGDLPNTTDSPDGITVQFKVTVLADYAVKEISNQAQISFDNLLTGDNEQTETNETTTTIIYNDPVLESEKTAGIQEKAAGNTDTAHPEVGDTLLYTIQTRNTSEDSLISNLVISDSIPEGLEYVPDSLTVDGEAATDDEDDDNGHYANGQVVGQIGDVRDTEWHTVTFQAIVLPGQAGRDIVNTALVSGDNIDEPDEPDNTVEVYPRGAVLESDKTASLFEKAEGNTDADHPEVGDTLLYTITTRNTISDGLVTNLTITDELPEGLEYVPGSLTVNGIPVTDAEDDDNGHYVDGRVVGQFGDVTDTDWRTLEFKATIQPGQAQKDIRNVAIVDGDNVDTPSRPEEEVEVYPRHPVLESEKSAVNQITGKSTFEVGDKIVYTIRTRTVVSDTYVGNLTITDTLPEGLEYVPGTLKVNGVSVTDAVYDDNGHYANGQVVGQYGDITDMDWHTLEFQALVKAGQAGQTIRNTAVISGDNIGEPGRAMEEIVVESPPTEPPVEPPVDPPTEPPVIDPPSPVLESRKTSRDINGGSVRVGDTIEYTIAARNTVSGSRVENLVISDSLPEGLEYVPGSLKVDGISVTDAEDDGNGQYADGKVTGRFGLITDTDWHTLEFQAKVKSGQAGQTIENTGEINGDNIGQPDRPRDSITVVRSGGGGGGVFIPNQPVLESQKTARNLSGDSFKAGDRIEYKLQARNTESYSVVTNLVIADQLPEGLVYVPGSLKVDGAPVTDDRDNDNGYVEDGRVVGEFGSISDTDWHSLEFQVEVQAGQAGKTILNTGEVTADNVSGVERPSEEIAIGNEDDKDNVVQPELPVNPELPGNPNTPQPPQEGDTESPQDGSDPMTDGNVPSDNSEPPVQPQVPVDNAGEGGKTGPKLPNTSTNVFNYLLAGCIILLAGLFLLRRRQA